MSHTVKLDIAITGGGIAGLWLLNRLRQAGYKCAKLQLVAAKRAKVGSN